VPNPPSPTVEEIIEKIVAYAQKQLPGKSELFSKFIRLYYGNTSWADIHDRSITDLYGAALSHWELMRQRKPKELKINVLNPQLEKDGWQSTHTVIQVIVDDMPFLVDSIHMELNRLGFTTHLMIHMGGIKVCRDSKNQVDDILSYHAQHDRENAIEAPISMEIDRQTDPKVLADIQRNIRRVLKDVRYAVEDWHLMIQRLHEVVDELNSEKMLQNPLEVKESKAFLEWLLNDHFTFLGCRDYEMVGEGKARALRLVADSNLGVLRNHTQSKMLRQYADLPKEAREMLLSKKNILILARTSTVSTVHRPTYTEYVGVKRFNDHGELIGERRFIGLYTSDVFRADPRLIPIIRNKVNEIRKRSGLPDRSHAGKDLMHILATLPRDDLFHGFVDELYDWTMGILHLQERRIIRLFLRKDPYSRFMSCLIYVPRENFTTDLVQRMQDILIKAFNGIDASFTTFFSESILARIHFVIHVDPNHKLDYDVKALEKSIVEVGVSWEDGFRQSVLDYFGEERGNVIFNRYRHAFPAGYRENITPSQAIFDVEHIEKLSQQNSLGMNFYRPLDASKDVLRFKVFRPEVTVPLSDALPILENMGLRVIGEAPYLITFADGKKVWINDFNMTYVKELTFDVEEVKPIFQEAFEKIWFGEAENDYFNRLVLEAELNWQETTVFRAYAKYFRQIGFTFSQEYIAITLVKYPKITRLLINLFKCYFDPNQTNEAKKQIEVIEQEIQKEFDSVAMLDEDRILRRYLTLIHATLRTTYFQLNDNNLKPYLAFKLDSEKISDMPLPLPKYEIFVYSPNFEGVHLRAAKVARGGIRWSDRREDFRTEILGLMKAQQVKNAIIVPAGAKGGFVVKRNMANSSREEILQEGIACYQNFIRGLLDLTDNIEKGEVISPKNTVCYDSHDPYLVVAADKGTATFSDIANRIAIEKQYWMGDAFASGGSTGYDHKKIAITARGAWISAERHFQELGINVDQTEITMIGIGDMSGDVFGNGALMSKNIKLVAAFNHQHIFLDPNPSPKESYEERLRLFNMPRSTWDDYNRDLISAGGGVYSRSVKSIRLSPEVQTLLGVKKESLIPTELIRAILKAPVDLFWNGGIGTYVKATDEQNDVGDRSNDAVRVNGKELRARVVCEGGNLGFTQLGRIEYALNGGKINTDFIDNSGGVDCSDHEVNIKILLNSVVSAGDMTEKQRNSLLASMADEVAKLVLQDNYHQNNTISLASFTSSRDLSLYQQFTDALEKANKLNRSLEFLPDDKTILERRSAGIGLTRPELAILFAYSKIVLKEQIKKSALVRDPYLALYLKDAFPAQLSRRYESQMQDHYLAKEIISTQLTNRLVSEMGITFAYQMQDEASVSVSALVRSYIVGTNIFKLDELLAEIDTLDYQVEASVQYQMKEEAIRLVRRSVRWLLRNRRTKLDIAATVAHFTQDIAALYRRLPKLVLGADKEAMDNRQRDLIERGVPAPIALKVASTTPIFHALNIIEAATTYQEEVFRVAKIYFMLADRLELFWIRERINVFPIDNRWGILARTAYKGDLDWIQRELTVRVLLDTKSRSIPGKIKEWWTKHESQIQRWQTILTEMRSADPKDFAILFVAIRELFDLSTANSAKDPSSAM
jgi:glutamate dehydrogenase